VNIRIDGIDVEMTPIAKQAVEKHVASLTARADKAEADLVAVKADAAKQAARADGLAVELDAEKKARADAASPEKVAQLVKDRVALETVAQKHLGQAVKLDGLDDHAVRIAVVEKLDGVKLDAEKAKNATYVEARFDGAVSRAAKSSPGLDDVRRHVDGPPSAEDRLDAQMGLEERALFNMRERLAGREVKA